MTTEEERAAVLALMSKADPGTWSRVAWLIELTGSALQILEGEPTGEGASDYFSREETESLAARVSKRDVDQYQRLIYDLQRDDIKLLTVLDDDYPQNLRLVFNHPPFLFIRGNLRPSDNQAIAVVGTRAATDRGIAQATQLAAGLARQSVTVLSGLAYGIDTAAHAAALAAGGRTVSVMGTGIRHAIYPKANAGLAAEIVRSGGALVSQFWPDHPPMGPSFPMRNIVMSGMAIGTVVIEASRTSGAKNQARRALEHGKRLFLVESLVLQEKWAQDYAENRGATVIRSVDDILDVLVAMAKSPEQLSLI